MIKVGLDFDNTLIEYDELFKKLAVEKNLIPDDFIANKIEIRDYLRKKGLDSEFTILQGLAYGPRILEAKPPKYMKEVIKKIITKKVSVIIVSHKTQFPYIGPKYDLREFALEWMKNQHFFSSEGFNLDLKNIFFKSTKIEKVNCIVDQKCNYFVDDLIEILKLIPSNIKRIHYSPNIKYSTNNFRTITNWKELLSIINEI